MFVVENFVGPDAAGRRGMVQVQGVVLRRDLTADPVHRDLRDLLDVPLALASSTGQVEIKARQTPPKADFKTGTVNLEFMREVARLSWSRVSLDKIRPAPVCRDLQAEALERENKAAGKPGHRVFVCGRAGE
jgi:hypothetical protein